MAPIQTDQTWKEVVRDALVRLGGKAHLNQINAAVKDHPKTRTNPTWKETIRRVVRQYTIFRPVPPQRSGIYQLIEQPSVESAAEKMTGTKADDHGRAQGMLLALGRLYGYETFAPASDRTSRNFQGHPLSALATITDCSHFCGKSSLPRVRQIDAIWLTEDNYGTYPAYAFEVENTTRVRSGIDRLVEIPDRYGVKLFVIAPGKDEQKIFDTLIIQNRYRRFRERLRFRDYLQLESLYNVAIKHDESISAFGVAPRRS